VEEGWGEFFDVSISCISLCFESCGGEELERGEEGLGGLC